MNPQDPPRARDIEIQAGLGLILWNDIPIGIVTPAGAELFTTIEDCIGAGMSAYTMISLGLALPAIRRALQAEGLECIEDEDCVAIDNIVTDIIKPIPN